MKMSNAMVYDVRMASMHESLSSLESSTDTTAASPLTPSSSISEFRSNALSLINKVGAENEELSEILRNYIAVGVLRKRNPDYIDPSQHTDGFPEAEINHLEINQWIQTRTHVYGDDPEWCFVQVFVLPDDTCRKAIPRSSTALRRALRLVMSKVNASPEAWEGRHAADEASPMKTSDAAEDESLWYIFNTLRDPDPKLEAMRDPYARRAMRDLLLEPSSVHCNTGVLGLKTPLYPYQRRSAATMVQREAQPAQILDPRLQPCMGPTGQEYYYDKEEGSIVREKRLYSEACGGILAETMGCGKTLISLAVILATRGHFPSIPLQHQEIGNPVREKTASLVQMAAAAAGRFSLPWKSHFDAFSDCGMFHNRCVKACEENCGSYVIQPPPAKYKGRSGMSYPRPPPKRIRLCSGTLIVVPPNLLDHWQNEIAHHTEGLKVLILRTTSDRTPSSDELLAYDIVLFSKTRFEKEAGEPRNDQHFFFKMEVSPLTELHWLRIIVDEGHNVAGHGHRTNMVHLLAQLHVERRWVVSGTPSNGLYGVEVSLASQEADTSDTELPDATSAALRNRKKTGNAVNNELKDLDKLRLIVVDFLHLKPWSNSRANDPANWTKYNKPIGEDGKRRKAPSLRATLQSLVVRHRLDVINSEILLPRLYNKVVYLEPTFYDKLSINMFLFVLEVNAITSERKDQDYMFHPRNRKHLSQVISNLREAGFWWAGSGMDIQSSVDNALKYLEKNSDKVSEADAKKLIEGMEIARKALESGARNAFTQFHELGVYVQNFPSHARSLWALDSSQPDAEPLLLGISQARQAQKFVTSRLNTYDPAEGLAGAGIKVRRELAERAGNGPKIAADSSKPAQETAVHKPRPDSNKSPKKTFSKGLLKALPVDSSLAQTRFVATASAKLTYLLDRAMELHTTEKIIIFYDNNNTAFWIAEGLEMLGIDFRIYANTLKNAVRTAYLALFNESEEVRVLLMDLRQASHGLHIASASRVFIVNPIWQPNVESQAIKRAHRIGQTRPVFVETLVLKDTLEDKILKRRKEMSDTEIQKAQKDLLDDSTMSSIIENEPFIPMPEDEASARPAFLKCPSGFFDRHKLPIPDDVDDVEPLSPVKSRATPSKKRKHVAMSLEIPTIQSDVGDMGYTPKRRKSNAGSEFVNENGILMTTPPPRSRTPQKARARASPHGVATGNDQNANLPLTPSGSSASNLGQQSSLFGPF